jgi:hypothetical protein
LLIPDKKLQKAILDAGYKDDSHLQQDARVVYTTFIGEQLSQGR